MDLIEKIEELTEKEKERATAKDIRDVERFERRASKLMEQVHSFCERHEDLARKLDTENNLTGIYSLANCLDDLAEAIRYVEGQAEKIAVRLR